MSMKRKSPILVKILACLLLLGSLAMLALPWLKIAVDTNSGRMDLNDLLSVFGLNGESVPALVEEMAGEAGQPLPRDSLGGLIETVLSGKFSPPTCARLCGQTGELLTAFNEQEAARTITFVGYGIWGLLGLLALLGLIALICIWTDSRGGMVPYLLLAILTTAAVVLGRMEANRYLEEQGRTLLDQAGAGMLLSMLGMDFRIVKMGIAAYLCPLLALLAQLLMCIRKKAPVPAKGSYSPYPARRPSASPSVQPAAPKPAPKPVGRSGWTCSGCGTLRGDEERFCTNCGAGRPAFPRCPKCGRSLSPDALFCSGCGARL